MVFLFSRLLHRSRFDRIRDIVIGAIYPLMIGYALIWASLFTKIYVIVVMAPIFVCWAIGFGSLVLRKRRAC